MVEPVLQRPPRRAVKGGINADYSIDQDWESFTADEHARWDSLFERQAKLLPERACNEFMAALGELRLSSGGIPHFGRLSDRLEKITGWRVIAVPDLVPDDIFFEHLANRRFPAGSFIRNDDEMDYIQEPDVFHDVFGHVPMLAIPTFADYMQAYGQGGLRADGLGVLHNLARLYWYTVEFGLMNTADGLRVYGAGILSSKTETQFSLKDPSPNRIAFDLVRLMRTNYRIDDFQQTYFVIDSFQQLLDETYQDFGEIYRKVKAEADLAPEDVLESDTVHHLGTQAYFK